MNRCVLGRSAGDVWVNSIAERDRPLGQALLGLEQAHMPERLFRVGIRSANWDDDEVRYGDRVAGERGRPALEIDDHEIGLASGLVDPADDDVVIVVRCGAAVTTLSLAGTPGASPSRPRRRSGRRR